MDQLRVKVRLKKNWQREQISRKWRRKGGVKDHDCDGRSSLNEIWEEWEKNKNGEHLQEIEGFGNC